MDNSTPVLFDLDLGRQDIQSLSNADAVAAFFARLGYKTERRIIQTPGNLGITADSTARPIKKIELLADQEGLFQVYLFELQSITVGHTRALARAFRNRAGNYLFVLTSDYERLDFVFLERDLPQASGAEQLLTEKQSAIRPRVLTIERRNPTPIQLRVLRRLTRTESDPYYQYEKLKAAYDLANWSEEYFNNRALFSDYYLKERLQEFPVWKEDPKPAYLKLREIYQQAASRFGGKEKDELYRGLVRLVLDVLGFSREPPETTRSVSAEPHYTLYSPRGGSPVLALCQVYPWDRSLDGKDDRRDKDTPEENPGAAVVSLLEKGESAWVVVTNGRLWRLYSQRTHAPLRWMIGALKYESPATVILRAAPLSEEADVSAEVTRSYLGGLKVLQEGKGLPEIFSETALNAVKRLGRIRDGVKAIRIQHKREVIRITERLAVNVDELVSRTFESIGSVEGKLEMVTVHSQRYFRVYEPVHGRGVVCYFAPELLETVKGSLGKRVMVSGTLRSDRFGRPESITVTDFRSVVEEDALPKPSELRGLVKGMTAGEKAEEYLRKLRGD